MHFIKPALFSRWWMWLWRGGDWVSCLGGWMAVASLRFLAHCLEMTLPVSLSTSAGRGRIFIFFLSCSLSLFLSLSSEIALSFSLSPHPRSLPGFLSMPLSLSLPRAGSSHVTASLELLEWGMGEREKGGREEGKEGRGKGGWADSLPGSWGGGGILQVAAVSQSIAHWAT